MSHGDPPVDSIRLFPDSEITDLRTPDDLDALFTCLADHRRRLLIDCLSENPGPLPVERLVEDVSERETGERTGTPSDETRTDVTITLRHNHLPRMDEAALVEFDHEANTVSKGGDFDVAAAVLDVV